MGRFVRFVSHENWSGVKNFVTVIGVVAGAFIAVSTAVMVAWFPDALSKLREPFGGSEIIQPGELNHSVGLISSHRAKANRCRSQMYEAMEGKKTEVAKSAAVCAETSYKKAVMSGDDFGNFGLFDLYQDSRLAGLFAHRGDIAELRKLSRTHWCRFAITDHARQAGMHELFQDIVCE